ncbi:MAG: hypothetical protein KGL39_39635 [Patescibacteria group bacterium]|nr:hypothetical protein [Patescibacteria group bacterium]
MISPEQLERAAKAAHAQLPDNQGFILIVAPFGQHDGIVQYASNIHRDSAIGMLKTMLFRWGINEEWMTQAK